jgi:hypothetical protein
MDDLIVLVPDNDAKITVETLLATRQAALEIRTVKFDVTRDVNRDAGTFLLCAQAERVSR